MTPEELVADVKEKLSQLNASLLELAKAGINVDLYINTQRTIGWGANRQLLVPRRFYTETVIR